MSAIETIQFNETGMVPAIAQDHITGKILMMAWMNKEASISEHRNSAGGLLFKIKTEALV